MKHEVARIHKLGRDGVEAVLPHSAQGQDLRRTLPRPSSAGQMSADEYLAGQPGPDDGPWTRSGPTSPARARPLSRRVPLANSWRTSRPLSRVAELEKVKLGSWELRAKASSRRRSPRRRPRAPPRRRPPSESLLAQEGDELDAVPVKNKPNSPKKVATNHHRDKKKAASPKKPSPRRRQAEEGDSRRRRKPEEDGEPKKPKEDEERPIREVLQGCKDLDYGVKRMTL